MCQGSYFERPGGIVLVLREARKRKYQSLRKKKDSERGEEAFRRSYLPLSKKVRKKAIGRWEIENTNRMGEEKYRKQSQCSHAPSWKTFSWKREKCLEKFSKNLGVESRSRILYSTLGKAFREKSRRKKIKKDVAEEEQLVREKKSTAGS